MMNIGKSLHLQTRHAAIDTRAFFAPDANDMVVMVCFLMDFVILLPIELYSRMNDIERYEQFNRSIYRHTINRRQRLNNIRRAKYAVYL